MSRVLVVNTGSSSIKYQLFDMGERTVLASGLLERVGEADSRLTHRPATAEPVVVDGPVADHAEGFDRVLHAFDSAGGLADDLAGIGHRVVHGGERFSAPTLIDDEVVQAIREQIPLAPLHNPSNLTGIEITRKLYPTVPQVAVFDTAFHRTMPARAYRYALPHELADRLGIRRYGFHGTSHGHVARKAAEHLGRPLAELDLITLHLGNGASVAAIAGGRCMDTSMGLTPLEGLVMGTRSGDLDPGVVFYLHREGGLSLDEIDDLLNRRSGLTGLTGTNDMREVQQRADAGDPVAAEALDIFCYRIRKYVGAYAAALGGVEALVFTAGIGEHSAAVRAGVCAGLESFGVRLDAQRNAVRSSGSRTISTDDSTVAVLVVPTDEELEIAEQTMALVTTAQRPA
jgi:acetate kinase